MLHINDLPSTNGIYIFKSNKTPIYIGKSINIKARVKSHIENAKNDAKEAAIIENADTLEYIVTDSEFKALLLESHLIQKHTPKYNVRWRDDKSYLYIKLTKDKKYPKLSITRKEADKQAIYFGPFGSVRVATDILREIRKVFPFCMQKHVTQRKCFYAKLKLCNPCPNEIEKCTDKELKRQLQKEYKAHIRQVKRVLEGKTEIVIERLYKSIHSLTKAKKFEEAIPYRNRLLRLEGVLLRRKFDTENLEEYNKSEKRVTSLHKLLSTYLDIEKLERIECFDMSTLAFELSTASMVVFTDGLSDKKEYKRFKIKGEGVQSDFDMFKEILTRRFNNAWTSPDLIIVDGGKPQIRAAQTVLQSMEIATPLIGIAKRPDRIIIGDETLKTIKPPRHHPGFRLVQALRDESHRFAKKYHVHLRNKKVV